MHPETHNFIPRDVIEQRIDTPPSDTWMSAWVGYHLRRMEAVECESDIALLMRFGASEVRRTFDGVPHALIWSHLQKQRAHRSKWA